MVVKNCIGFNAQNGNEQIAIADSKSRIDLRSNEQKRKKNERIDDDKNLHHRGPRRPEGKAHHLRSLHENMVTRLMEKVSEDSAILSQKVNLIGLCPIKEGKAFFPMSRRGGETNN